MALLQVYQVKSLKDLHKGNSDPGLMHGCGPATDLTLWASKITVLSLGQTMSTLVVQEHHLWLNLVDMRETKMYQFVYYPISQAGLFGNAVENFAQQFSANQKQMEAIQHILPRRSQLLRLLIATPARPAQQPSPRPQCGAGRRRAAQPVPATTKPGGKRKYKWP